MLVFSLLLACSGSSSSVDGVQGSDALVGLDHQGVAASVDESPIQSVLPAVSSAQQDADVPVEKIVQSVAVLEAADMVGAADWTGDGIDEQVRFVGEQAYWEGGSADLGGAPQVIRRARLPHGERLLVGTGMHRGNRAAPARVHEIGPDGSRVLWAESGPRNQIADLRILDGRIYVVRFVANKEVEGAFLEDGRLKSVHRGGLASQQIPLSDSDVLVGRVYGSKPKSDGDLRRVRNGRAQKLPSLRGVRTMELINVDKDDEAELLVGDGWHYAYGKQAVGRVFLLDGPNWTKGRTIAMLDGEYSARSIESSAALTGGAPESAWLLVTGTKKNHVLRRDVLGWQDVVVGPSTETSNAVWVRTKAGLAIWAAGARASRMYLLKQ